MPSIGIVGGSGLVSNLCLETLHASTVSGTPLLIAQCNGGDNQQFRMQPWSPLEDRLPSAPLSQSRVLSVD